MIANNCKCPACLNAGGEEKTIKRSDELAKMMQDALDKIDRMDAEEFKSELIKAGYPEDQLRDATKMIKCPRCHGDGHVYHVGLYDRICPRCNGAGEVSK